MIMQGSHIKLSPQRQVDDTFTVLEQYNRTWKRSLNTVSSIDSHIELT